MRFACYSDYSGGVEDMVTRMMSDDHLSGHRGRLRDAEVALNVSPSASRA